MIPPIDLLLDVSVKTLEDIELSSRNQSANMSKTLRRELEVWIAHEAAAQVARWMIEHRDELIRRLRATEPKTVEFLRTEQPKKLA